MTDASEYEEALATLDKVCAIARTAQMLRDLDEMFEQQKNHWSQMFITLGQGLTVLCERNDKVRLAAMAEIIDMLFMASEAQAELVKGTQIDVVGDDEYGRLLAGSVVSMTDALLVASEQADALLAAHS